MIANRLIKPGEPLTISYGPSLKSTPFIERQQHLKLDYCFRCSCNICLQDASVTGACCWISVRCPYCQQGPLVVVMNNNNINNCGGVDSNIFLGNIVRDDDIGEAYCLKCGFQNVFLISESAKKSVIGKVNNNNIMFMVRSLKCVTKALNKTIIKLNLEQKKLNKKEKWQKKHHHRKFFTFFKDFFYQNKNPLKSNNKKFNDLMITKIFQKMLMIKKPKHQQKLFVLLMKLSEQFNIYASLIYGGGYQLLETCSQVLKIFCNYGADCDELMILAHQLVSGHVANCLEAIIPELIMLSDVNVHCKCKILQKQSSSYFNNDGRIKLIHVLDEIAEFYQNLVTRNQTDMTKVYKAFMTSIQENNFTILKKQQQLNNNQTKQTSMMMMMEDWHFWNFYHLINQTLSQILLFDMENCGKLFPCVYQRIEQNISLAINNNNIVFVNDNGNNNDDNVDDQMKTNLKNKQKKKQEEQQQQSQLQSTKEQDYYRMYIRCKIRQCKAENFLI